MASYSRVFITSLCYRLKFHLFPTEICPRVTDVTEMTLSKYWPRDIHSLNASSWNFPPPSASTLPFLPRPGNTERRAGGRHAVDVAHSLPPSLSRPAGLPAGLFVLQEERMRTTRVVDVGAPPRQQLVECRPTPREEERVRL